MARWLEVRDAALCTHLFSASHHSAREEEWGRCEEQMNVGFIQTGSLQMEFSLLIWPNTVSAAQKYTNLHLCSMSSFRYQ